MTSRRVFYSAGFAEALRSDAKYLTKTHREEWIALLDEDVRLLERLVTASPRVGLLMREQGQGELRKLRLRRTPFVAWYVCEPRRIVFLRLFHVRQRSRVPRHW